MISKVEAPIFSVEHKKERVIHLWALQDGINQQRSPAIFQTESFGSIREFQDYRQQKIEDLVFRLNILRGYFPGVHSVVADISSLEEESAKLYGKFINAPKGDTRDQFFKSKSEVDQKILDHKKPYTEGEKRSLGIIFNTALEYQRGLRNLLKTE